MIKVATAAMVLVFLPLFAQDAQDSQCDQIVKVPIKMVTVAACPTSPEVTTEINGRQQSHAQAPPPTSIWLDKKFIGLNLFLWSATAYDAETTFSVIRNCPDCAEGNPLMRPFIKSGRLATYGFTAGLNSAAVYYGYRLRKNNQKLWWLPLIINGTIHTIAGSANLRFVF